MPIIEGIPSGDDHEDLVRINQHIEACVRANPAEYLWVHRRFKTRPKGEASVY
jgi:Kdo2-lipid IVA lauroyltransferase/acyltransferase